MRIFISDRRYFAIAPQQRLRAFDATTEVFVDMRTLTLGADFVSEVPERIARCDAVRVLIGPSWRPERLYAEHDFVRDELVTHEGMG